MPAYIEIETDEIVKVTAEAVLVRIDKEEVWVPKSQIYDGVDFGYSCEGEEGLVLEVQEWWAIKEDLV